MTGEELWNLIGTKTAAEDEVLFRDADSGATYDLIGIERDPEGGVHESFLTGVLRDDAN